MQPIPSDQASCSNRLGIEIKQLVAAVDKRWLGQVIRGVLRQHPRLVHPKNLKELAFLKVS
jgi:hypothetical protein